MYAGLKDAVGTDLVGQSSPAGNFLRHMIASIGAMHLMEAAVLFGSTQIAPQFRSTIYICCMAGNGLHGELRSCNFSTPSRSAFAPGYKRVHCMTEFSQIDMFDLAVCACMLHKPWLGMQPTPANMPVAILLLLSSLLMLASFVASEPNQDDISREVAVSRKKIMKGPFNHGEANERSKND